jgi:hypothetical protein
VNAGEKGGGEPSIRNTTPFAWPGVAGTKQENPLVPYILAIDSTPGMGFYIDRGTEGELVNT